MRWELKNGEPNRIKTAKQVVADYFEEHTGPKVAVDDLYLVWFCKTLKNYKVMISTDVVNDIYFEVTFNGETNEIYLDVYTKQHNRAITMEPFHAS